MPEQLVFAMEVFLNGLMAGVMYALVALGFVLIFKASGIFNFAQGVMALFAAMTLVGIQNGQVPFAHLINAIFGTKIHYFGWEVYSVFAILLTVGVMILLAWMVQRFVFRHLVGQEPIILFMATIGLAYFLEGVADLMWGSEIKRLDVCLTDNTCLPQGINLAIDEFTFEIFGYGFFIDNLDITATIIAILLVTLLVVFHNTPNRAAPCALWPMTIRPPSASACRSTRSGSLSGRSRASSPWSRAACGVRSRVFSSHCL